MKYAENNRISHRQLYYQIILSFLAPLLICIPGNDGEQGLSGAVGIMAAVLILLLYVFFLMRTSYCYADPVKIMGKLKGSLLGIFFLIYLIMTGVYILSLIEQIVPVWAVSGIATGWLIFWAVAVCAYGADQGMQRRGRMAGVSGGIFLFVIILMLLLCIGQGNAEYLKEMLQESRLWGKEIVYSTYDVVCAFSGISLLPFVLQNVEKRGNSGKIVTSAILTVSGILLLILFILPSVLGWGRIQKELYPVLPLMAGADLPGNVLARFDVLWIGFLLYGLFFALGSCFHYGIRILDTVHLRSGKYWLPIVIYAFSFVRIQICLLFRGQKKRRKKTASAVAVLMVFILSCTGCAGIEPEKRMYPLAMGVDVSEGEYILTYAMPDLPRATGQGKEEEDGNQTLQVRGKSFEEIKSRYERSQEKYLDIGHLQILILSQDLTETDMWKDFFEYLREEPLAGENIYVFQTQEPEKLLGWKEGGTSVGEYITGFMENRMDREQKNGVTLRQVYYQWYQNGTLKKLPKITLSEDQIQVWLE